MPDMLQGRILNPSACILFLAILCSLGVSAAEENGGINIYGGYGPDVLCVFPMSGPYNLLQRLLFYVLLVFAVVCRRQRWLVFGALGGAMSYSGAAALHGLFLSSPARKAVDLDIYGIFTITSSGAMLTAPLLNWSSTLIWAEKRKRCIVIIWGTILVVGAIFTASAIHVTGSDYIAPECIPHSDADAFDGSLLPNPAGDCMYACAPETRLFRLKYDVVAWPNYISRPRDITSVFLPATIIYVLAWIFIEILFRTAWLNSNNKNIQFATAASAAEAVGLHRISSLVQTRENPQKSQNVSASIQTLSSAPSSSSSWLRPPQTEKPKPQPEKPRSRCGMVFTNFHLFLMLAHFAAFVVNVVMCEYRMMKLPSNEQPYEVGQWISWVSVALLVLAQVLNRYLKLRWSCDEKKRLSPPDEENALGRHSSRFGIWQGQQMSNPNAPEGMKMFRSDTSSTMRRNSF
ncbi:hypothetical protein AJ78_07727 [Emergomyces pasteurianus Ep9510]|uniref:Uncharacterized protein n=1 Tax=Emergomyces pasteurianus Ep9510 TaxID=1447872 RepID=A0A1J9P565_9EURO|nr:hypothetical protein AJ78_07727 [Emergomyces pasteurianus Ep9510]